MKDSLIAFILILLILFAGDIFANAQTVTGTINQKTLTRGKSGSGKIILTLPVDIHVNSNKPGDEFLLPTKIKFVGSNVKISKIIYPHGIIKKFIFSETPLSIYDGRIVINFTFTIPNDFKSKSAQIVAVIEFQPCNDEVCFPPKKEKILLTAKIK